MDLLTFLQGNIDKELQIVVVPSTISALRWHFAEERLCHCGEAETRRGHLPDWPPVWPPRRMQVADRAEKFWPHNEEANLDNVQEERVFPLLSLGSTHPSTFSNTEDRRWWCSQTRLPLTWPGSRLGCSSVLLAASACCKVYPNFRRLLSRAAIPWHPTLTVALCVQPFLHFCPWLRPSFWETYFSSENHSATHSSTNGRQDRPTRLQTVKPVSRRPTLPLIFSLFCKHTLWGKCTHHKQ